MSFVSEKINSEGLTFDDVLLVPAYSDVVPKNVVFRAWFGSPWFYITSAYMPFLWVVIGFFCFMGGFSVLKRLFLSMYR